VKLSVLMPAYNEGATLAEAVKAVLEVVYPCEMELVVVDDGSTDTTPQILAGLQDERIVVCRHVRNRGKGAAIRTAAQAATGDYVVVCDADLEYASEEIVKLLQPVLRGDAQVVYGTRTFGSHTAFSFWYVVGNKAVTMFANALFNTWISDLETCYKLMPLALYRDLDIRSIGFGTEAEVTGKLLKRGQLPYEVPISYKARRREDGKKLTWRDGVEALWILTRVRLSRSQPSQPTRSAPTGQPDPTTSPPSSSSHPRPHQSRSRAGDDLPGDGR
jgi:dolichol-phosphate hexosyltransferase